MKIDSLFVAGSGFMGHGIAQSAAMAGISVTMYDIEASRLSVAFTSIQTSLKKLQGKGALANSPDEILSRIRLSARMEDAANAQLVIEAVPEVEAIKLEVFQKLDAICPAATVFCTNTSAFPISKLAAATRREDRFCGMHFFSPVVLMPLVEVIKGVNTSDATLALVVQFARDLGKEPIRVLKDAPGFVVSRILSAAVLEAIRLVESGVAEAESIDKGMRLGCGHKMGPLETADMAGLDVVLSVAETMRGDGSTTNGEIPKLLKELVQEGKLGRKTGEGFFKY